MGDDLARAYLLRRRSMWGRRGNVDVVPLPADGQHPTTAGPVLLRVERVGRWNQGLQALALGTAALPLPVVLSVLAALERMSALSSSG
jgi:hypothetical protein